MISARSDDSHSQVQVHNRFWPPMVSGELPIIAGHYVTRTARRREITTTMTTSTYNSSRVNIPYKGRQFNAHVSCKRYSRGHGDKPCPNQPFKQQHHVLFNSRSVGLIHLRQPIAEGIHSDRRREAPPDLTANAIEPVIGASLDAKDDHLVATGPRGAGYSTFYHLQRVSSIGICSTGASRILGVHSPVGAISNRAGRVARYPAIGNRGYGLHRLQNPNAPSRANLRRRAYPLSKGLSIWRLSHRWVSITLTSRLKLIGLLM